MAIGLRRKVRLDSRRERQGITRRRNSGGKRAERSRRDQRLAGKLDAQLKTLGKDDLSADVHSWVAQQLGKPVRQASEQELKALVGSV